MTLLNIPVEKKAIVRAEEMLENMLTPEENTSVKKLFRCYMVEYIMQFIVSILRIIQIILKVLAFKRGEDLARSSPLFFSEKS